MCTAAHVFWISPGTFRPPQTLTHHQSNIEHWQGKTSFKLPSVGYTKPDRFSPFSRNGLLPATVLKSEKGPSPLVASSYTVLLPSKSSGKCFTDWCKRRMQILANMRWLGAWRMGGEGHYTASQGGYGSVRQMQKHTITIKMYRISILSYPARNSMHVINSSDSSCLYRAALHYHTAAVAVLPGHFGS